MNSLTDKLQRTFQQYQIPDTKIRNMLGTLAPEISQIPVISWYDKTTEISNKQNGNIPKSNLNSTNIAIANCTNHSTISEPHITSKPSICVDYIDLKSGMQPDTNSLNNVNNIRSDDINKTTISTPSLTGDTIEICTIKNQQNKSTQPAFAKTYKNKPNKAILKFPKAQETQLQSNVNNRYSKQLNYNPVDIKRKRKYRKKSLTNRDKIQNGDVNNNDNNININTNDNSYNKQKTNINSHLNKYISNPRINKNITRNINIIHHKKSFRNKHLDILDQRSNIVELKNNICESNKPNNTHISHNTQHVSNKSLKTKPVWRKVKPIIIINTIAQSNARNHNNNTNDII